MRPQKIENQVPWKPSEELIEDVRLQAIKQARGIHPYARYCRRCIAELGARQVLIYLDQHSVVASKCLDDTKIPTTIKAIPAKVWGDIINSFFRDEGGSLVSDSIIDKGGEK